MAGVNLALYESRTTTKGASSARPCIFLSHLSTDKSAARAIGNYITQQGDIDIYLDIHDQALQDAVQSHDASGITALIERGLSLSTHITCIISNDTARSWWVPYELGFAKSKGKHLSSLKLKDVTLPAYLEISEIIHGTDSLNLFLTRIRRGLSKAASVDSLTESLLRSSMSNHPLDPYLDWKG
jgi:hypothetical protein